VTRTDKFRNLKQFHHNYDGSCNSSLPQLSSGGSLLGSRQLITYARRTRDKLNIHSFAISRRGVATCLVAVELARVLQSMACMDDATTMLAGEVLFAGIYFWILDSGIWILESGFWNLLDSTCTVDNALRC